MRCNKRQRFRYVKFEKHLANITYKCYDVVMGVNDLNREEFILLLKRLLQQYAEMIVIHTAVEFELSE